MLIMNSVIVCCILIAVSAFVSSLKTLSSRGNARFRMSTMSAGINLEELISRIKSNLPLGSVIVVKYGGHAMENSNAGYLPVIVHGGGPQIASMLKDLKIESKFIQGLRVTDEKTMEVAQMVLCGSLNKEICGLISSKPGVRGAIGLSGLDGKLISAKKIKKMAKDENGAEYVIDLGLVGDPSTVNAKLLRDLLSLALVPVIAPVAYNEEGGGSLNLNADTAAGAVAEALKADKLLMLTDVAGVLDKSKNLIEVIQSGSLSTLIEDGTISGGMIPKLENAVQCVEGGVGSVAIMDGRERYSILRALSGEVFGTKIVSSVKKL